MTHIENQTATTGKEVENVLSSLSGFIEFMIRLKGIKHYFYDLWESLEQKHGKDTFNELYFEELFEMEKSIDNFAYGLGEITAIKINQIYFDKYKEDINNK